MCNPSWLHTCLSSYSYEITNSARLTFGSRRRKRHSTCVEKKAWTVVPSFSTTSPSSSPGPIAPSPHASLRTGDDWVDLLSIIVGDKLPHSTFSCRGSETYASKLLSQGLDCSHLKANIVQIKFTPSGNLNKFKFWTTVVCIAMMSYQLSSTSRKDDMNWPSSM